MGDYPDETAEWVEPEPWNDDEPAEDDEDAPFNMDADYIELEDEAASKKNKKMDKKARKAEKRAAEAAAANAELSFTERTEKLKEAATELNNLQGEGMIGDLRTRFKYVKSAPVSFGLTPYEILMATDAELNEIASVKFLAPYRRGGLGTAGRGLGQRVRSLKAKIADRKWGDEMPEENDKKKRRRTGANKDAAGGANAIPLGDGAPKKRLGKKERHRAHAEGGDEADASAAAPAAAPAGGKRKREDEEAAAPPPAAATEGSGEGKKKRRKKKKAAAD
jgi:protein KRI1